MSTKEVIKKRDVRVSPTAPESKALSAKVWQFLENDVPGFNEAMEQGTAQIKAAKTAKATRLKDGRRVG